jgi:hypothetical protein
MHVLTSQQLYAHEDALININLQSHLKFYV